MSPEEVIALSKARNKQATDFGGLLGCHSAACQVALVWLLVVSEHQHEQTDNDQQTDEKNDANGAAQKLQHGGVSCCSGFTMSD